ncbi:metallophosphoesterase family protein [Janthinobacterium fluminis]|uniref:Metallophosphoesterase n=1 Tax=Janthinobacterium fluminis TaxID=2987524 RepID=A0ABT5K0A9_9BURK|nr:metallophosphoesterase [Janthinobacterium fluminis]MDC8758416.1 metallophosphoesterase [Janthinobacterium fluminis]
MRVFALSDMHVDFDPNAQWVAALSRSDYQEDVLILAGDISDSIERFTECLDAFARRFRKVFFVPGNHDLWVVRDSAHMNSLDKFEQVKAVVQGCGASMEPELIDGVAIVPLFGWYDGSFGELGAELRAAWMDCRACRWPAGWSELEITQHFIGLNEGRRIGKGKVTISFSHFLPRIDLMPAFIPPLHRKIYPVLGSSRLEGLIREIRPDMHVYGHSHVNRDIVIDGVNYINNAFAYPHEERIAAKALRCIYQTGSARSPASGPKFSLSAY